MNLNVKYLLISITVIAVVCDTMLLPFYPGFFASAFGITDPAYVGGYIAAFCLVVLLAFPCWARLAEKRSVLNILLASQLAAAFFSLLCYRVDSLSAFWLVSLLMFVCKASYLLIYPLVMRLETPGKQGQTIGLLSLIVHFGAIGGAVLGGVMLQCFEPRQVFVLMACGDLLQTAICCYLKYAGHTLPLAQAPAAQASADPVATANKPPLVKLALLMLLFYFSAYLMQPFFVSYWQQISASANQISAALVFAIPAFVALLVLLWQYRFASAQTHHTGLHRALWLTGSGLALQALPQPLLVIAGRCLFGLGLFLATVRLDLLLFRLSTPERYAADFSKIYMAQSLGVLLASYCAGAVVAATRLSMPLLVATAALALTWLCYLLLFSPGWRPSATAANASQRLQ
ncbi:MAG: MFS transporter [Pseudomonadota bacterium]